MSWREAYLMALMPYWPEDQEPLVALNPSAVVNTVQERINKLCQSSKYPDLSLSLVPLLRQIAPEVFDFWDEETLRAVDREFFDQNRLARPAALCAINPRLDNETANAFFLRQERDGERIDQMRLFFLYNPIAPSVLQAVPKMGARTPIDEPRSRTHRGSIILSIQIEEIVRHFEAGLETNEYDDRVGLSNLDLVEDEDRVKVLTWHLGELHELKRFGPKDSWFLDRSILTATGVLKAWEEKGKPAARETFTRLRHKEAVLEEEEKLYRYVFHDPEDGDPQFLQYILENLASVMESPFGVEPISKSFFDWIAWVSSSTRRLERALGWEPMTFMMDRVL